jgi:Holliday junction DNA helicase RuvA
VPALSSKIGQTVTLVTLQYLESEGQGASYLPRLIGFPTDQDRRFFGVFTTVKGIGNRKALRAMAVEPAAIARAVASKDAKELQKLPEIGKRLAETMIAELHGKVDGYLTSGEVRALEASAEIKPMGQGKAADEAVAALVALGETPQNAERKVQTAVGRLGRESTADEIVAAVFGG